MTLDHYWEEEEVVDPVLGRVPATGPEPDGAESEDKIPLSKLTFTVE